MNTNKNEDKHQHNLLFRGNNELYLLLLSKEHNLEWKIEGISYRSTCIRLIIKKVNI